MIFKYHHSLSDVSQSSFQVFFSLAWKPEPTSEQSCANILAAQLHDVLCLEVTCRHELYAIYIHLLCLVFFPMAISIPKRWKKSQSKHVFRPWACSYHVQQLPSHNWSATSSPKGAGSCRRLDCWEETDGDGDHQEARRLYRNWQKFWWYFKESIQD